MRALPILFNTEMVRAILEGRKTVTRRVVKPKLSEAIAYIFAGSNHGKWGFSPYNKSRYEEHIASNDWKYWTPPYHADDILYVRETWRVGAWDIPHQMIAFDYADGTCGQLVYIANREMFMRLVDQSREDARKAKCVYNGVDFVWEKGKSPCRWRPSIHMPREAARIWLRVTDVRVERLQEITRDEAIDEGCNNAIPILEFKAIWDSTIKPADLDRYGWAANPWVWVISFERYDTKEAGR